MMNTKTDTKEELLKFLFENKILAIGSIIFLIVPGIWMIFFFNRERFWEMDVVKLIVLSVSICIPVFAYCFLMLFGCFLQFRIDMDYESIVLTSIMLTALTFIITIGIKLCQPDMRVEHAMLLILSCLLVYTIGNIVGAYRVSRKE